MKSELVIMFTEQFFTASSYYFTYNRSSIGETPLEISRQYKHQKCVKTLECWSVAKCAYPPAQWLHKQVDRNVCLFFHKIENNETYSLFTHVLIVSLVLPFFCIQ